MKQLFRPILGFLLAVLPGLNTAQAPVTEPVSDHCAGAQKPTPFTRSRAGYTLPDVVLVDQAGRPFPAAGLLDEARPIAVNFIFTTCTTICPVMSTTFAQTLRELGEDADRVHFVSISIDPEQDTPAALARYAGRFQAPPEWTFLTGSASDVQKVLKGFDVWTGSKLSHRPITLLRRPGETEWVRLEGLGNGSALATEVRALFE